MLECNLVLFFFNLLGYTETRSGLKSSQVTVYGNFVNILLELYIKYKYNACNFECVVINIIKEFIQFVDVSILPNHVKSCVIRFLCFSCCFQSRSSQHVLI